MENGNAVNIILYSAGVWTVKVLNWATWAQKEILPLDVYKIQNSPTTICLCLYTQDCNIFLPIWILCIMYVYIWGGPWRVYMEKTKMKKNYPYWTVHSKTMSNIDFELNKNLLGHSNVYILQDYTIYMHCIYTVYLTT